MENGKVKRHTVVNQKIRIKKCFSPVLILFIAEPLSRIELARCEETQKEQVNFEVITQCSKNFRADWFTDRVMNRQSLLLRNASKQCVF